MTTASQVNCVLHTDQKTSSYAHHQRALLKKSWCNMGTKNAQNSPKKHLCKTSTAWRENRRCFSVKNNYQWWHMGSSVWPSDEKKITGIASSVVNTRKKICGTDFFD